MSKKNTWVKVVAVASAVVGGAVAVAAYLKKKSKSLSEELDFDNSLYFDEDPAVMEDEDISEESVEEEVPEDDFAVFEETAADDSDKEAE